MDNGATDATPLMEYMSESTMFSGWFAGTDHNLGQQTKESELLTEMDTPTEREGARASSSHETTTISDWPDADGENRSVLKHTEEVTGVTDVARVADPTSPPSEASLSNIHWLEEVASRYGVHLRTLDRWLKATGIVPHRDAIDLRRRYLTHEEVNTLDQRYGHRRASHTTSQSKGQENQESEVLARITSLQEEVEQMKQRLARVDALDRELDQLEQTMREIRSRVGRSLKEVTKLVTATRLDDNLKNEEMQHKLPTSQEATHDPDNFPHNRKRA
jgi:hypothetical protein